LDGITAHVTTYRITQTTPTFEFSQVAGQRGARCGACRLDEEFARCLESKIGTVAYQEAPVRIRDLLLKRGRACYMNCADESAFDIPLPRDYGFTYDQKKGVHKHGIRFTDEEVKRIFDPSVTAILRLLEGQIRVALRKHQQKPKMVLLVGEFAEHSYIQSKMTTLFKTHQITTYYPPDHKFAIARGAVYQGLDGLLQPAEPKIWHPPPNKFRHRLSLFSTAILGRDNPSKISA